VVSVALLVGVKLALLVAVDLALLEASWLWGIWLC